jgi:hypothetical protein
MLFFALLLNGCIARYFQQGVLHKKVINSYAADTLTYRDFVVCNIVGRYAETLKVLDTNTDSLMKIVNASFVNNDIPLRSMVGSNQCDQRLIDARPLRGFNFKTSHAIKLLDKDIEGLQLIPVIYIDNIITFTGSISSAGVTDDQGFLFSPFITFLIIIFDGDELVYRHMVTHKADALRAPYLDQTLELPSAGSVTQENWDELVRRTMRRYMKRVER